MHYLLYFAIKHLIYSYLFPQLWEHFISFWFKNLMVLLYHKVFLITNMLT